jgi:stage V sporulation protein AC
MVSAAMEYKKEGYIFGMGAKLFTVAGPVIVFGTISSVIVGILYYFL